MKKKFSQSSKVWVKMGLYYLQHGKLEALHDLVQKCVKVLPKYKRRMVFITSVIVITIIICYFN